MASFSENIPERLAGQGVLDVDAFTVKWQSLYLCHPRAMKEILVQGHTRPSSQNTGRIYQNTHTCGPSCHQDSQGRKLYLLVASLLDAIAGRTSAIRTRAAPPTSLT